MLRSYLEKNDEFVNEEFFLKEMIQKFGPKVLQSYPELWNERQKRIERLRAETNLNIKGRGSNQENIGISKTAFKKWFYFSNTIFLKMVTP